MRYNYFKASLVLHFAVTICIYLSCSFNSIAQSSSSLIGIDQNPVQLNSIAPTTPNIMATTFPCDGKLYYVVEDNGIMKLVSVRNYTGTNTPISKFECTLPSSISVSSNALGANPVDGFLYFLEKKSTGKTQVRRLDATCNTSSICPVDMIPFNNAGCFDHLGRYWVIEGDQLSGWDLNSCSRVKGPFNLPAGKSANDLIYNTQDCFFYSGNVKVDASGNSSLLGGSGVNGPGIAMGIDGKVYAIGGGNASSADLTRYDLPSTNGTSVGTVSPGTTGGTDAASFPCSNVDAAFTITVAPGCTLPRSVSFTDNSSGLITSWLWDFGDGSPTSTLQNPTHIYSTSGPFSVKLTVGITTSCLTITSDNTTNIFSIPASIGLTTSSKTDVICYGGNNGSATVTVSGGTGPFTYTWSPSAGTGATISNLSANTYTLTVTDNLGCTAVTTAAIAQPTALTLSPLGSTLSCIGGADGSVSVTASGGTVSYNYLWTPSGASGTTVSNLSAGTYTITVTDNNSCTKIATATVANPAPIVLTPSSTDATCGGNNGSASITASGGSSPYTYLWTPGGTSTATLSGISGGSYTVTITDNNSCSKTTAVVVNNSGAATLTLDSTFVTCNGGADGTATVSVSGGSSPYTYSWNSTPAQTTTTATGLSAGMYTIVVKDNAGCIASLPVNIIEPSPFILTPSQINVSCSGGNNGSATVTVTGGTSPYTYTWSASGGTGSSTSNLSAGTYSVTVTDNKSCTKTVAVVITVPAAIAPATSKTDVSCFGGNDGTSTVSVSGGTAPYSYAWSPAGQTTSNINTLTVGTYTLTVTDSLSCTATATSVITEPLVIALPTSKTDLSCYGDNTGTVSVTASGGTGPYTYSWMPLNGTLPNMSSLPPNTYTITVTDNNGCTQTATALVTEPSAITWVRPLISTPVSCFGGNNGSASVSVSGGTAPYTYVWLPSGGTGMSASNLTTGTYTVVITDSKNCSENDTVTISQPLAAISLTLTVGPVSCIGGNSGTASVSVTGGTSPYTYAWSPTGATTSSLNNLSTGTYTVTVTDNKGCSLTTSSTIIAPPALTLATPLLSTNVSCFGGSNGSATVSVSGGTTPYTYKWSPSGGSGITASNLGAGTHTVIVTDNNNCTQLATVAITQPADIIVTALGTNITCGGGSDGTVSASVSGGTGPYLYSWSPSGKSGSTLSNLVAGAYTVTVTDNKGCAKTATTILTEPPPVTADFTPDPYSGDAPLPVNFTNKSSGGLTYTWFFGDGAKDSVFNTSHTYGSKGSYTVTLIVTDANGCSATISKTVEVLEEIIICVPNTFTPNDDGVNDIFDICGQGLVVIEGSIYNRWGMLLYMWDTPKGGWNGRTASGEKVPDGVYYYLIIAEDNKGKPYTQKGFLQLFQ